MNNIQEIYNNLEQETICYACNSPLISKPYLLDESKHMSCSNECTEMFLYKYKYDHKKCLIIFGFVITIGSPLAINRNKTYIDISSFQSSSLSELTKFIQKVLTFQ